MVPHGYVGALQVDPVEKKPFFHALPGARALSFGMLGCDYHCGYCFVPGTEVITSGGPRTLDSLFDGGRPDVRDRDRRRRAAPRGRRHHPPRPRARRCAASSATTTAGR